MSDEYTPSVDDLRMGWADLRSGSTEDVPLAFAEFDRALAAEKEKAWDEGYRAAVADERYDVDSPWPNPYYRAKVQQ